MRAVAFGRLPDGRVLLASGSKDDTVRLYDLRADATRPAAPQSRPRSDGLAFLGVPLRQSTLINPTATRRSKQNSSKSISSRLANEIAPSVRALTCQSLAPSNSMSSFTHTSFRGGVEA